MKDAKHWVNLIENDPRDDQSLAEQERILESYVKQIQADVFGECAQFAKSYIGAAAKEISSQLQRRVDALIVSGHADLCDVNDFNIEGIKKPCNCGYESIHKWNSK